MATITTRSGKGFPLTNQEMDDNLTNLNDEFSNYLPLSGGTLSGGLTTNGLIVDSTGAVEMPVGSTAQRPTPVTGMLRFNSTEGSFEGYDGSEWGEIGGGGSVIDNGDGTFTLDGDLIVTGDVTSQSDARVKENFEDIPEALSKVLSLKGTYYNRVDSVERKIGLVAQEVEKVIPELVSENSDGLKSVAYANTVALLIEAIKELNEQVQSLKDINNNS